MNWLTLHELMLGLIPADACFFLILSYPILSYFLSHFLRAVVVTVVGYGYGHA
jgi:hypothetical protein